MSKESRFRSTKFGKLPSEWEITRIGELIKCKAIVSHLDGNHGAEYPRSHEFVESGVPYISANAILSGIIDFSKAKYLTHERSDRIRKGIAKDGDVLFAHNATVGPVAILETDKPRVILSTTLTYYRCNEKIISSHYLKAFLESDLFKRQYTPIMAQSTRNQVPITTQRTFFLVLPPIPEQRKIAEILNTWGEAITKTEQLIAALQERKKGLMQRLLTGEVRFPGFETTTSFSDWRMLDSFPKDWDIAKLGGLCEKIQDGNYGPDYPRSHEFVPEGIPFLTGKALTKSGINYSKIDFITEEKHLKITKAHIKHDDVLFANRGSIGGAAIVPKELDGGNIGPQVTLVRTKRERLHPEYLFYFFQSDIFNKQAYQVTAGSALAFFGLATTSKFKIPIPSLPEQRKIAEILQTCDATINLQNQELNVLQQQKKGLMQLLLTGVVRVKI